jgi:hypothetical protein
MLKLQPPLAIKIAVAASQPHLALLEAPGVLERCSEYAGSLMRELGLPLQPRLELQARPQEERPPVTSLCINGVWTGLWSFHQPDPGALEAELCDCLLRCRSLFVDSATARRLGLRWFPGRASYFDDAKFADGFQQVCAELVSRGLRPERARDYVASWKPVTLDANAVHATVEQVLANTKDVRVGLRFSPVQHSRLFDGGNGDGTRKSGKDKFSEMLEMMSDGLFYELGFSYRLDDVQADPELSDPWFRVRWNDISTRQIKGLTADEFLVNDTVDRLTLLNVKGTEAINPANQSECAIVHGAAVKTCEDADLTTWDADAYVVLYASSQIRQNAGSFATDNLTALYLTNLSASSLELVAQATKRFDSQQLTRILRLLLDEEISIRDLRTILNALLAVNEVTTAELHKLIVFAPNTGIHCPVERGRTLADLQLTEYCDCVRTAMRRQLSHKYTRGGNTLVVYLLAPAIENRLMDRKELSPMERKEFLTAIGGEVGNLPPTAQVPVILTTWQIRRRLRDLIAYDLPRTAVLSYQDLSPDMNIQPLARIDLPH